MGTFVLIFIVLTLYKIRSRKIPMTVGFLVGGMLMSTSSMMFANPQVTVARMFTNTAVGIRPADGLIFIVMQFAGAFLALVAYKIMFRFHPKKQFEK